MLLQFTVQNYGCFADRVTLSLLAVPGEPHPAGQTVEVPGIGPVLRSMVVYGANASGKSNLVMAFETACGLAAEGVAPGEPLSVRPHRLDPEWLDKPTTFELELHIDGVRYSYGLCATTTHIVEEWLHRGDDADPVFEREHAGDRPRIAIGAGIPLDPRRREFYEFVAEGTRPEQPFLAELRQRNASELAALFRFLDRQFFGFPTAAFTEAEFVAWSLSSPDRLDRLAAFLRASETGIRSIRLVSSAVVIQQRIDSSEPFERTEAKALADAGSVRVQLLHADAVGGTTPLDIEELSDGTRRLLLAVGPIADEAADWPMVWIDELDRSFHTELTLHLVDHLNHQPGTTQFVFTTHDTNLLDGGVFGRDAIWFVEKDVRGAARLFSLAEFERAQLDALTGRIEQGYLQGRFGAIPFIGNPARLRWNAG